MEQDKIYESVVPAVDEVLTQMGASGLNSSELKEGFDHCLDGGLCVIVGFSGQSIKGVVALYYSQDLAMHLAHKIFTIESDTINDEVCDSCGELSNMICGTLKKLAVDKGLEEYNITVPTIIGGTNYRIGIQGKNTSKVFGFELESGKGHLLVELKLEMTTGNSTVTKGSV